MPQIVVIVVYTPRCAASVHCACVYACMCMFVCLHICVYERVVYVINVFHFSWCLVIAPELASARACRNFSRPASKCESVKFTQTGNCYRFDALKKPSIYKTKKWQQLDYMIP